MKIRKIALSTKDIDNLRTLLREVPDDMVGDHLSDDEFVRYTIGELSEEETLRIDKHLESCSECTIEMERLLEGHGEWCEREGLGQNWDFLRKFVNELNKDYKDLLDSYEIYKLKLISAQRLQPRYSTRVSTFKKQPEQAQDLLNAFEKECILAHKIDEQTVEALKNILSEFMQGKRSYTSLVSELLRSEYILEIGLPHNLIVILGKIYESYFEKGILETVVENEKEEQRLLGEELVRLFKISKPEEVFTKIPGFNCVEWEIKTNKSGFSAEANVCRFCDIVKKICSVSACELFCLNPIRAALEAVAPDIGFTVKKTLWDADGCVIYITIKEVA